MRIKMLETKQGAPDGHTVKTYQEGETYEVPESLACVFVREEWAEPVSDDDPPGDPDDTKDGDSKKENKDAGGAAEDKSGKKKEETPGAGSSQE